MTMAMATVFLLLNVMEIGKSQGAEVTNQTSATNAAVPAKLTFKVDRYEVTGNTVLASNVVARALAPFTGDAVNISTITNAMATLQLEYYHRGYVTVKVTAPPQQVTNRVIYFQITEGRLATVKIVHNHFFSSNNIISALPYVKTLVSGQRILNSKVFQTELDRANANPDRQISPEVRPGLEPGTTALILDVKDRLPLHGRLEFDNYSPPGTPELRVNANISYDNLWQLNHSLGFQYGFSPNAYKPSLGSDTSQSYNIMDAPQVAYYSGFYRAPLGAPSGAETQITQDPTHFGYNETTKQFVTPPATSAADFTAYASRSTTGPTLFGPETTVVSGSLFSIEQQLISQQYTAQDTVGGRLSFPLPTLAGIQSSWNIGIDYKDDKVVTQPTNFFFYSATDTHGTGTVPTVTTTNIAIPGDSSSPALEYVPISLGWTGSRQDHWLQRAGASSLWSEFDGGVTVVVGTGGAFSKDAPFPILIANSAGATKSFVAVRPRLSRTQVLPDNFTFYGSLSGQWANEPLLNLEQLALGGNATVRGYREGELYADTGFVGQAEIRSPFYWRGASALKIGTQLTVFTDYGRGYQLDQMAALNNRQDLWGAGAGVNINFGAYVESHILVAWPLLDSTFSEAGRMRISFSLSAKF